MTKGMPSVPVSVIVMTKNEEKVIDRTLDSVRDFSEVFVVDSGSTDETVRKALSHGARVVDFRWTGDYPKKKEWCLDNLPFSNDWILYLDADESVSIELASEISHAVQADQFSAYDVVLDYTFLGGRLRHGHRVRKRVLLRRDRASWPHVPDLAVSNMWEVEGHYQPVVDGAVGQLRSPLRHWDPDPLFDYFARHNRYSDWEAYVSFAPGLAAEVFKYRRGGRSVFPKIPCKPIAFFLYSYIIKLGFLDGLPGFHYAIAHAFYYWQIGLKLRELWQDQAKRTRASIVRRDRVELPSERGRG